MRQNLQMGGIDLRDEHRHIGGVAVGAVVASRNRRQPLPLPDVPVAASPAEVRVKAVERKPEPSDHEVIEASAAVAIVCGANSATADRYEVRNDALRSIARRELTLAQRAEL